MKLELKDFQVKAVRSLTDRMVKACNSYYRDNDPASCCLTAPTGSGKTIMVAAAAEALFNGNPEWGIERDPLATILWVSDSPSLNEQTNDKFCESTDLDNSIIETIENTFTRDHDILEPGHIYFLNRQKLSPKGLLARGGEAPTFWNLLRRTIHDPSVHLFMLFDEAHKGLGNSKKTDRDGETIAAKIIDSVDGKSPMPVVVGISATPGRFTRAMKDRSERIPYPNVRVKPAEVQASGLLKEKIILLAPTEGAAVYSIYLSQACRDLVQSTRMWDMYCTQNKEPVVYPLMVVQVPDKVSNEKLRELCSDIYEKVGDKIEGFSPSSSFAHVISEGGTISTGQYEIRYVKPQDVQRDNDIRVLFAKEAITTGWDCPRAEVIFSLRQHSDFTYIAQLIGRMVRTPLARCVDIDVLNSVSCYLPYFDPDAVDKVVKYLTDEDNDDFGGVSGGSGRQIIKNPVDVKWDSSFGVDDVFTTITSRERGHHSPRYIDGLLSYSGMLEENEIVCQEEEAKQDERKKTVVHKDSHNVLQSSHNSRSEVADLHHTKDTVEKQEASPHGGHSETKRTKVHGPEPETEHDEPGELEMSVDGILRTLNEAILIYSEQFEAAKSTVRRAQSKKTEFQYLNKKSVSSKVYEDEADAYAIANARRSADITLSPSITNAFFRQEIAKGMDPIDINIDIAAAAAVPEIVGLVVGKAKERLEELTAKYDSVIVRQPPSVRDKFSSGMYRNGISRTVYLDKPVVDTQDKSGKAYPRHVVNDPVTHMAYFNLYDSEDSVVRYELKRVICWYRNPVGTSTNHSLRINYYLGGKNKALHPDFIFFEKVNGKIMPAIVDPHGIHLSDMLPKLRGTVRYVEEFGDTYSRYWVVSDYKEQSTYLDLKDPKTREVIMSAADAYECFEKCGRKYKEGTLARSKDGYRKK